MATKKKVVKKKSKKITKKQLEEISLKFAKDNLDNRKRVYERYIEVLVKYGIKDIAYSAIGYDELFNKALLTLIEKKDGTRVFHKLVFGEQGSSELEGIEKNIKYYDSLIEHARDKIYSFSQEIKTKIAKDAIEKRHAWLNIPEYNG